MTQEASRFVGSIPQHYDEFLGPRLFNGYAADLAKRVVGGNPDSVLELAAGTGIVSRCLRDHLPDVCSLVVTDLNAPMLEVAQSKFQAGENVRFETVDATVLPYEGASFDTVACQFGVMFFPDKQLSYQEALRVLRPGGKYFFNVWGSWSENPFAQIAHQTVAEFFPVDPPGFYKVPFGYHDTAVIEESLVSAGFARVTVQNLGFTSPIGSAEEFGRGLVFGNPLFDEVLSRGGDPDQVCAAVTSAIAEQLGEDMPIKALVIEAEK